MKGPEAAGLSVRGTQDGLAALSKVGTACRYEYPNRQERTPARWTS